MRKILTLLVFVPLVASSLGVNAQSLRRELFFYPIEFQQFFSADLQPIHIWQDSTFQLRTFILNDGEHLKKETYQFQDAKDEQGRNPTSASFYWPQFLLEFDHDDYYPMQRDSNCHRLLIVHGRDSMLLDLHEVYGTLKMDSLVVTKGFFSISVHPKAQWGVRLPTTAYNSDHLQKGITPTTLKALKALGAVQQRSKVDLRWLSEESLPPSYHLRRASCLMHQGNPEGALVEIQTAVDKRKGEEDCESHYLRTMAYAQAHEYGKAIASLNASMRCPRNLERDPTLPYVYRSSLYTLNGQLQEAAADLDTVVSLQPQYQHHHVQRALFRLRRLHDPRGVKDSLMAYLARYPMGMECPDYLGLGVTGGCEVLYLMAEAEMAAGQEEMALRLYADAALLGMGMVHDSVAYFMDTLLLLHPSHYELKLATVVAHLMAPDRIRDGGAHLDTALFLLNGMEMQATLDHRMWKYKAWALCQNAQPEEAMQALDRAMLLNDEDAGCYWLRAVFRGVFENTWPEELDPAVDADPDVIRMRELCAQWRYVFPE